MNISIIIPIYNREEFINTCFESLLKFSNAISYEVVFVNDGSTDDSLNKAQILADQYSFVTCINQENQGAAGARNTGMKHAKGEYFCFLDTDDWLNIDVIEELFHFGKKNNFDLVSYKMETFDENYKSTGIVKSHPILYNELMSGKDALIQGYQPSSACVFLYKKDFIFHNNLSFFVGITQEDVEFTARLLLVAKKVFFSSKIAYNYYKHSGSVSTPITKEKKEKYLLDAIKVAVLIKEQGLLCYNKDIRTFEAIQKNYNSVVWNLLLRFITNPKEVDFDFKMTCLEGLKKEGLYPIKGKLKTNFQKLSAFFFNIEFVLNIFFKI